MGLFLFCDVQEDLPNVFVSGHGRHLFIEVYGVQFGYYPGPQDLLIQIAFCRFFKIYGYL